MGIDTAAGPRSHFHTLFGMSSELTWSLVRDFNAYMYKRCGVVLSREPGNVASRHSYKFSALAQPGAIRMEALPGRAGVSVSVRRVRNVKPNAVAGAWTKPHVVKAGSQPSARAVRLGRMMQATGCRLDIEEAAEARMAALVASTKKQLPKGAGGRVYRRKLQKLSQ